MSKAIRKEQALEFIRTNPQGSEWDAARFLYNGSLAGTDSGFPTENAARSWFRRFRRKVDGDPGLPVPRGNLDPGSTVFEEDRKTGSASFAFKGSLDRPMTVDELLQAHGVDLEVWEVERVKIGSWGVTCKIKEYEVVGGDGGTKKSIPTGQRLEAGRNFSCQATLVRRKEKLAEILEAHEGRILSSIRNLAPGPGRSSPPFASLSQGGDARMLEVSIFDLHLGKLAWGEETGSADWDTKIAASAALSAAKDLLEFFPGYERIWLPLGHDFFNSDGPGDNDSGGRTTRGTSQDEDTRWARSLGAGVDVALALVELCRSYAPVDVTIMRGNHDEQRCVYLGKLLEEVYRNDRHITVDNSPRTLKCKAWGDVFLATCHGQNEALQKVVVECAIRFPSEFATTRWREIHTGHGHRMKNAGMVIDGCEEQSIRWRMIPSLCSSDAWHSKNLYHAHRAAECYLWGKKSLYLGHHSHCLPA